MTDKPIIFSGPMVRALLEGRKTQTRRALKIKGHKGFFQFGPSDTKGYDWTFRRADHVWEDYEHDKLLSMLPVQIGDRLWVREAITRAETDQGEGYMTYAADHKEVWPLTRWYHKRNKLPSIHMPRWASRLTLTATDVRVQRLNEISEADAIAEGCRPFWDKDNPHTYIGPNGSETEMMPLKGPIDDFRNLWNSINGPDAWEANPWVAAYTFTVGRRNIDQ
jgi:hypothetical protein